MNDKRNILKLSVVIPVFNEQDNIAELCERIFECAGYFCNIEIIFIDDGSTDSTIDMIKKVCAQKKNIFYLSLSRNFGHQNALRAGLDFASGDAVVTMDGDMQHPPEIIPEMISQWQKGHDIVFTIRKDTADISLFKRKTSALFYHLMNMMTGVKLHEGSADFRLMDRKVVNALKDMQENNIFYRGLISWVGFRQCSISYAPNARAHGKSKYSFRKMFRLALDGMTAFSFLPLRLAAAAGFTLAFLSFFYVLYAVFIKMFTEQAVSGWLSVMAGIYFLGGVQLVFIGLCGEYIGRIFMEVKGRPHYLIAESNMEKK